MEEDNILALLKHLRRYSLCFSSRKLFKIEFT
jgi:hypothetical protein